MEKEIWKTIKDYPDYMVSNLGRVKSLNYNRTGKERILKQGILKNGYLITCLRKDNKSKTYLIHRLVATHFLSNPNNYSSVNHIDENKANNHISNLEWMTHKQNCNYGMRNEKIGKANSISHKGLKHTQNTKDKISKTLSKPIAQLTKNGAFIKQWGSGIEVERELNIKQSNICNSLKGRYSSAGGFKWMYLKDYYNTRTLNRMENIFTKLLELRRQVS